MANSGLKLVTGAVKIIRNNQPVSTEIMAALQNVQVQQELNTPAMFSMRLSSLSEQGSWQDINLDAFKPGDDIEVQMGLAQLDPIIIGKITAVEPSFREYASVTIRGFDLMYQLRFGTRTEININKPYSDIFSHLATQSGLTASIEGEPGDLTQVSMQDGISNYDYLLQLLKQLDFEMLMSGTRLKIRPSAIGQSAVKTLQYPRDVSELDLNLKIPTAGDKVTVTGWDMLTNKVVTAEVSNATVQQKMDGNESGYQAASDFPSSAIAIQRQDVNTQEAAESIAKAEYQKNLNRFIEGSASLFGDPQLTAGVNIRLAGLSDRFNGLYYVTGATHGYDSTTGYKTEIQLQRTGV
jgi:Phage protein D